MNDKKEFLLVILLGVVLILIWEVYYNSYEKKYTIGTVLRKQTGMKSGTVAIFEFSYNNKIVEGGTGIGEYSIRAGDMYLVEFAQNKINLSKALFYYPIPDTVKINIPNEGWKEIPNEIKKYRVKRKEYFGLSKFFYDD